MNSSGYTTRSAPSAAAVARARRARSALPATSPTVGLSCAMAIARCSGGRWVMDEDVASRGGLAKGVGGEWRIGSKTVYSLLATRHSPLALSERRLRLQQQAVALGAEFGQGIIGRKGRAEIDRSRIGEDPPIAKAGADVEVRQHLVVDEGLGLAADAAPAVGDDVGHRAEIGAQQVAVVVAHPRIGDEGDFARQRPALAELVPRFAADPHGVPGGVEDVDRGAERDHDRAGRAAEPIEVDVFDTTW